MHKLFKMFPKPILRHILFPSSAFAVVHAKGKDDKAEEEATKKVRPCDLPLYVEDKKCITCTNPEKNEKSFLTDTIRCARQELMYLYNQAKIIRSDVEGLVGEASQEVTEVLNYLHEENNTIPRFGAIAIGGLAGYIMGLRRGMVKRLIYTSTGAGTLAALCYPNEAKEYAEEAVIQAKKYFVIGYHLVNGVTSDLIGNQLPPLPIGHLVISDKPHPPPEAVPSSAHLLPPTASPTHIPLPHEDPHEMKMHHHPIPSKD